MLAVLIVELVEGGNLPPKRRSGVASENKHHRLRGRERRQLHRRGLIQLRQRKIGRSIPGLQMAGPSASPHGFKRNQEVRHSGHALHDAAKCLWSLVHRPPDVAREHDIENGQYHRSSKEMFRHKYGTESYPKSAAADVIQSYYLQE